MSTAPLVGADPSTANVTEAVYAAKAVDIIETNKTHPDRAKRIDTTVQDLSPHVFRLIYADEARKLEDKSSANDS